MASIVISINNSNSGYNSQKDEITIGIGDGDIEDDQIHKEMPIWKQELLHEMIHEYHHKVNFEVSETARILHTKYQLGDKNNSPLKQFSDTGHNEKFYTAIEIIAKKHLRIRPEDLIEMI